MMLRFLSFLILCYFMNYISCACPVIDNSTFKRPPSVLNIVPSQTGYSALIEVLSHNHQVSVVEEIFYQELNIVQITVTKQNEQVVIYYNGSSEELFIIEGLQCFTYEEDFASRTIDELVGQFFSGSNITIFFNPNNVGITGLMLGPLMDEKASRFFQDDEDHWLYCKKDEYLIDIAFANSSKLPSRINSTINNETLVLNYLSFVPRIQKTEVMAIPHGFNCERSLKVKQPNIPQFAATISQFWQNYYIEMQASYTENFLDKKATFSDRARLSFQDNIYSVEIASSQADHETIKFVFDSNLRILYRIAQSNGTCQIEKISDRGRFFTNDSFPIQWPLNTQRFNILDEKIWSPNQKFNYLGQTIMEGLKVDIFEGKIPNFSIYQDMVTTTYFFEANSPEIKAPAKILISPHRRLNGPELYRIEVDAVFYTKHPTDNLEQFDLSPCYENHEEFLWFQISFTSNVETIGSLSGQEVELENSFREKIHDWFQIPKIRVPQVKIAFFGPSLYISGKLLERPRPEYLLDEEVYLRLKTVSKVYFKDSLEECSEVCFDADRFCRFSYCKDTSCLIFVPNSTVPIASADFDSNCNTFTHLPFIETPLSPFYLMNSRKLLNHLTKNFRGMFVEASRTRLFADDLYVIKGPNELGRSIDPKDPSPSLETDYKLLKNDFAIKERNAIASPLGLSERQCLMECENSNNCHSLSYCSSNGGECIMSTLLGNQLNSSYMKAKENCFIFSKNYIAYFKKIKGKSVVTDDDRVRENFNAEECAKECLIFDETCLSFDICVDEESKTLEPVIRTCLMHSYHINKDPKHGISPSDLSNKSCSHYYKKLSMEFDEYKLRKLGDKNLSIISVQDSLENCAGQTLSKNYLAFEFCEKKNPSNGLMEATCRVTSTRPVEGKTMLTTKQSECSVFIAKSYSSSQSRSKETSVSHGFTFALAAFLFLVAAIFGGYLFILGKSKIFK